MNVLYLITNLRNGVGGHNYSLYTTAKAMAEKKRVKAFIWEIGNSPSPVLKKFKFYNFSRFEYFSTRTISEKIKKFTRAKSIDIVHCFDQHSLSFAETFNIPYVTTKCGGANSRTYLYTRNLILYSNENFHFYEKLVKNVYFVPNRATKPEIDSARAKQLKTKIGLKEDDRVFLKISRINRYYERSIRQAISLAEDLNEVGFKNKLVIIGTINDQELHEELTAESKENIYFITESCFTTNASELLQVGDFFIGTGRGIMEASSISELIFCATKNSRYPVLLNQSNFHEIFRYNFSERYSTEMEDNEILKSALEALGGARNHQLLFYRSIFRNFFDINSACEKHLDIYSKVIDEFTEPDHRSYSRYFHLLYSFFTHRNPKLYSGLKRIKN